MLGSYEAGAGKPGERRRFIRELERITDQAVSQFTQPTTSARISFELFVLEPARALDGRVDDYYGWPEVSGPGPRGAVPDPRVWPNPR